ncbi:MAG: type II toxin-antitoxin system VapC family toxin [Candidatus Binatia bacterium]
MMIADTDVLIDFLQGRGVAAERIGLEIDHGQLHTTAVTRFELLAGVSSPRQEKLVAQLLEALPCLPLDSASADQAAAVRRLLEKRGQSIGMGDSLIAGITLANKGVLLTRNRQHFERVPGLALGTLSV